MCRGHVRWKQAGGADAAVCPRQVIVTGNKFNDKLYKRHTTGRPGSMKVERFKDLQAVGPAPLPSRS